MNESPSLAEASGQLKIPHLEVTSKHLDCRNSASWGFPPGYYIEARLKSTKPVDGLHYTLDIACMHYMADYGLYLAPRHHDLTAVILTKAGELPLLIELRSSDGYAWKALGDLVVASWIVSTIPPTRLPL